MTIILQFFSLSRLLACSLFHTLTLSLFLSNTHTARSSKIGANQKRPSEENIGGWQCSSCTFRNHPLITECELCGSKPPADQVGGTQHGAKVVLVVVLIYLFLFLFYLVLFVCFVLFIIFLCFGNLSPFFFVLLFS